MKLELLAGNKNYTLSPLLHSVFATDSLIPYPYTAEEIADKNIENYISEAKKRGVIGFNATIPYKTAVIPYLDYVDLTAKECNSVNTVVINSDGKLKGYTTDGQGFLCCLKKKGISVMDKICAVLGGLGGAGSAITNALVKEGGKVYAVTRSKDKTGINNDINICQYDNIPVNTKIIVNATPVGTQDAEVRIINLDRFPQLEFAFDCVYNPPLTDLLKQAFCRNIKFDNGLTMLFYQGYYARLYWGDKIRDSVELDTLYEKFRYLSRVVMDNPCIILSGYMGCGKSTVGKILAQRLGYEFIDTDEEIESRYGAINKIFEEKGEARFREIEKETVENANYLRTVISLGGGAIIEDSVYEYLKSRGTIIYLKGDVEELYRRVGGDGSRPLAQEKEEFFKRFYKRKPLYEQRNDILIETKEGIESTVANILEELARK